MPIQVITPTQQRHQPSFLQSVLGGLVEGTGPALQQYQQMKEKQRQESLGEKKELRQFQQQIELQKQKYEFEKELESQKLSGNTKTNEKIAALQGGIDTLNRMKQIGQEGNLGRGSGFFGLFPGQTARDRGEYERLGKSLISLSTTIPIRNQREFEVLAGDLYDPSVPDSEREGILTAMQRILENSLSAYQEGGSNQSNQPKQAPKERPPLTSFHR